ncbi:unnamed protein product [Clonostachys rhizophaga]|uniref:F-box domain-containing protein n=1 Tax=Clonostachys rhizophaga TaxID=160324 RepID=A0A9N9VE42_9HYPO|nr:unnamed protein product [Clonostachys rhizophaga]
MDAGGTLSGSDDRLSFLAPELQEKIIVELDPASVIAISQTNRTLRNTVDPGEGDINNLILAMELTPEYGGPDVPTDWLGGGIHDRHYSRKFSDPDVETHRWACTTCHRLRSHVWFDNQSVMGLSYQKPDIGTPAAAPNPWVPTSMRTDAAMDAPCTDPATHIRHQRFRQILGVDVRNIILGAPDQLITFGLSQAGALGIPDVTALAQQPLQHNTRGPICKLIDDAFKALDAELCGQKRRFRTCIECQVRLVHDASRACGRSLAPCPPIVRSRQMPFKSPLHRFFPEVATWPPQGPMPWPEYTGKYCEAMHALLNLGRRKPDQQFPLHLIRCPECHTWQEQRAFRLIETDMLYDPPTEEYDRHFQQKARREIGVRQLLVLDEDVLCNHCFYNEYGAEDLEDELVETFRAVVNNEIVQLRYTVYENWQNYLRFAKDRSDEMLDLIYAHADPEVPRAYKLCEDEPMMTKEELEAVTAGRFYKFAVAVSEMMQSNRWVPVAGLRYFVWAAEARYFIERWIYLEGILARLDAGTDSLSEWALARRGPCLT